MAQSYDRRINMYINIDGKDVVNSVKSIRAEMSKIIAQQANMTVGSEEYVKAAGSIRQLKGILKNHAEAIGNVQTPMQKLIETAKGLLPSFSFGAIAAIATKAFTAIKDSTHATADLFEFAMAGMNNGMDQFWKTMATGDFTNFISRMKESIEVGYKYASMLDEVDDKTRALSMVESDARGQELKLEENLKNKGLGKAAQIQAGKDRIALEEKLSIDRQNIANERFDAEVLIAQQQSQLSREQLIQVAKDIDSKKKLEAQAYKEKVNRLKELESLNVHQNYSKVSFVGDQSSTATIGSDEMQKLKSEISATSDSVKEYAGVLDKYDILTVDQQKKFVSAYVTRNEAINSAPENLKKVITKVNNLLAGVEDNGQKIEDEAAKARKEASDKSIETLDAANNERISKLTTQYETENWSDDRFKNEMIAAEQAYLVQKKALLEKFGQSTVDVDKQINDKRIEVQKEKNKAQIEEQEKFNKIMSDDQEQNSKLQQDIEDSDLDELIKRTNAAIDQSKKLKDDEAKLLEERKKAYLDFSLAIGQSFGNLMNDSEASTADYLKNILVLSLDALHQFFLLKQAEVWIDAAAGAATGRIWKIATAVAAVAAMEAAYQGIRGALTSKKSTKASGYAEGGFTHGETTYIAGEAGQEYIAPAWQVKNPITGPMIAQLEAWRRNPVTVSPGAIATSKQFSQSTFSSNTKSVQYPGANEIVVKTTSDPELKKALEANTHVLTKILAWNPKIVTELVKKDLKLLDEIERNSGL